MKVAHEVHGCGRVGRISLSTLLLVQDVHECCMRSTRYVGLKDVGLCAHGARAKRYGEKFTLTGAVSG